MNLGNRSEPGIPTKTQREADIPVSCQLLITEVRFRQNLAPKEWKSPREVKTIQRRNDLSGREANDGGSYTRCPLTKA